MRAEGLTQNLLDRIGLRFVNLLNNHEEFVAAHAEDMSLAGLLLCLQHDFCHRLDEGVARLMAVLVVHALEAVDVAEEEGTRDALWQVHEVIAEAATVQQPRHLVALAHALEFARGIAVADHNGDKAAQRHHEIARGLEDLLLRVDDLDVPDDLVGDLERHGDEASDVWQIVLEMRVLGQICLVVGNPHDVLLAESIVEKAWGERHALHLRLHRLDAVAAPFVGVADRPLLLTALEDGDAVGIELRTDLPEHLLDALQRVFLAQGDGQRIVDGCFAVDELIALDVAVEVFAEIDGHREAVILAAPGHERVAQQIVEARERVVVGPHVELVAAQQVVRAELAWLLTADDDFIALLART